MIPLFTQEEFENTKSKELLPLQCKYCGKTFLTEKGIALHVLDISGISHFNEKAAEPFLEIIQQQIETCLEKSSREGIPTPTP